MRPLTLVMQSHNIAGPMGLLLKDWRKRRGLTLRALGERSGVPYPSIQRIENGQISPTVATLEKLAAALDVPVRELFPTEPRPRPRRKRR